MLLDGGMEMPQDGMHEMSMYGLMEHVTDLMEQDTGINL